MKKYLDNILVCLNKFTTDTDEEIELVSQYCKDNGVEFAVSNAWEFGGAGALEVGKKIVDLTNSSIEFKMLYNDEDSILDKIKKVSMEIYGADNIDISDSVLEDISKIEDMGYSKLPICIAKTQYSLSDNPKLLGKPTGFNINIREVKLCSGAGFIVVIAGNIMTMPGLSKMPAYLNMDIDNSGNIFGLF